MNPLPFVFFILAGTILYAQNPNLIQNGDFREREGDRPRYWTLSFGSKSILENITLYDSAGGWNGMPGFAFRPFPAGRATLSQTGLKLEAGKKYVLSAYVKSIGFKAKTQGLVFHNKDWLQEDGFRWMPENSDWRKIQKTVTAMPSKDGTYGVSFFVFQSQGELHISNVNLVPKNHSRRETSPAPEGKAVPEKTSSGLPENSGILDPSKQENILFNGTLETDQKDFADQWGFSEENRDTIIYKQVGGWENGGFFGIRPGRQTVITQTPLQLVPGEKYRLSGYFRTEDFESSHYGLVLSNPGWLKDAGITVIPPSEEWRYIEKEIVAPESKDGSYSIHFFACKSKGLLYASNLRLVPVTQAAADGAKGPLSAFALRNVFPVYPRLMKIPAGEPFAVFEISERKPEDFIMEYSINGRNVRQCKIGQDWRFKVDFSGLPPGPGQITISLKQKDGSEFLQRSYSFRILPEIKKNVPSPKILNNLASELLEQEVNLAKGKTVSLKFDCPRDGWIYAALLPEGAFQRPEMKIKGAVPAKFRFEKGMPLEGMRKVCAGEYTMELSAELFKGKVVVRTIPEIVGYSFCPMPAVKENGAYDWKFAKKHFLGTINTFGAGPITPELRERLRERGLQYLVNIASVSSETNQALERLNGFLNAENPLYHGNSYRGPRYEGDGVSVDEFSFQGSPQHLNAWAEALRLASNPQNRSIYLWIFGKPSLRPQHGDFLSACFNADNGNGRLLLEAYCRPQRSEKEANVYLNKQLNHYMREIAHFSPGAQKNTLIVFGIFTQGHPFSLNHFPEVDWKYYLDMQCHRLANDPEFKDIAGTGFWGLGYADEEMVRWSCRLMRHYAVEGKRTMLSEKYGYRYIPGHLENGDFENGSAGWQIQAAETDSVRFEKLTGLGLKSQSRWHSRETGDQVCVMKRSPLRPNFVRQTAKNLEKGKLYSLQFFVVDTDDFKKNKINPRRFDFHAKVQGGEILDSYVHIDERPHSDPRAKCARTNLHRLIFRANSPEIQVVFTDWISVKKAAGPAGETLGFNFVQLKPYYEEE